MHLAVVVHGLIYWRARWQTVSSLSPPPPPWRPPQHMLYTRAMAFQTAPPSQGHRGQIVQRELEVKKVVVRVEMTLNSNLQTGVSLTCCSLSAYCMRYCLSACSFVPLCMYMYILAYLATCHLYILGHNTAVLTNLSMVHSRPMVWIVAIF